MFSRRWLLKSGILSGLGIGAVPVLESVPQIKEGPGDEAAKWGKGFEGQRKADLEDGRFLNPIMAGAHPNPTILKDGADYYMTFNAFESDPALIIWHSRDLVNWIPLNPALTKPIGSVLAVDLSKHAGRYYIYIPITATTLFPNSRGIYVIHADDIRGPWSEPVALNIGGIDPAHIVGEDGKRYLYVSGGNYVQLTEDGLATAGTVAHVYDGWKYPEDWVVEAFSLESPKLMRRGDYFYLVCAEGGTGGPPTSHMVTVARSKSVHGPWENSPHNPMVRTSSAEEPWWSRGHATFVEGPSGDWWMIYHAFENGFRTLGRQTLLEPFEWTPDGWPKAIVSDLSKSIAKPRGGTAGPHGFALSDDFSENRFGKQWTLYAPGAGESKRVRYADGALVIGAKGKSPTDCSPVTCLVGDHAYEISVDMELDQKAEGGLLLFFSRDLYLGMGHNGTRLLTYNGGQPGRGNANPVVPAPAVSRIFLRIQNDRHIVTFFYSPDGVNWTRRDPRWETSGYNSNTVGGLISLRPALYSAGSGEVKFRNFQYRAL